MKNVEDLPKGYKATELGVLPEEWDIGKLDQIGELIRGVSYKDIDLSEKNQSGFLPVLRAMNIQTGCLDLKGDLVFVRRGKISEKQILKIGDIVIAMSSGSKSVVGKAAQLNENWNGSFGAFCAGFRPQSNAIDKEFIGFLFQTTVYRSYIEKSACGTNIKNLTIPHILNYPIPLPPLTEEHAIAATLRTVQEAKEKTDDVIAATKVLKAAMMKHLFRYGPVPPEEAERVALKETEIGQVPEGWEVGQLKDYCSLIIDCPHSTPHFIETGILVIRTSNVRDGNLVFKTPSYISEDEYKERIERGEPQENDILFTREAPIGEACLVPTNTRLCLGQRMMLIRPDKSKMNPYFLMRSLYSEKIQNEMHKRGSGVTAKHLNVADVKCLKVPVPPLPVQNKITSILSSIDQKLAADQSRKEALDTMFTSLLHDLMTARIRVSNH